MRVSSKAKHGWMTSMRGRSALLALAATAGLAAHATAGNTIPQGWTFHPGHGAGTVTPHPSGIGETVWLYGSTALVNWDSFNLGPNNFIHFQSFTDPSFRVLNRTNQAMPSMIHGSITGTGTVGLINPAGVVFFGTSVINVGNFLAASANTIDENAFLSNSANGFSLIPGNGNINILPGASLTSAGSMILIGKTVTNRGSLTAASVLMVGGVTGSDDLTIKAIGDVISLRINGEDLGFDTAGDTNYYDPGSGVAAPTNLGSRSVVNDGTITATSHIAMAAGDLFGYAISNTGTINAQGGRIDLAATSGLVNNTGLIQSAANTGGDIRMAAPVIVNGAGGQISADSIGNGDAGSILVSSGINTILATGSQIHANGGLNGTGGSIKAFGDGSTVIESNATLTARGGTFSGDGGYLQIESDTLVSDGYLKVGVGSMGNGQLGSIYLISNQDMHIVDDGSGVSWSLGDLGTPVATESEVAVNTSLASVDANLFLEAQLGTLNLWTDLDRNPATGNRRVEGNLGLLGLHGILLHNGGETRISADGSIISAGHIDMGTFESGLVFDAGQSISIFGDIGHNSPLSHIELNAGSYIVIGDESASFDSNLMRAEGDIRINPNGNTFLEDNGLATVSVFSDSYLISSASGDVTFGPMQALSTTGDLEIKAANEATIGDLNVAGDLTVTASAINILLRGELTINYGGGQTATSPATSIIAAGPIDFSVTPTYDSGLGEAAPRFASVAGPQFTGTLGNEAWYTVSSVSSADLETKLEGVSVLGLLPVGPQIDPPTPPTPPTPPAPPSPPGPPTPTPTPTPTPAPAADGGSAIEDPNEIAAESQINQNEAMVATLPEPGNNAATDVSLADMGIQIEPPNPGPRSAVVSDLAAEVMSSSDGGLIRVSQQRIILNIANRAAKQYQSVIESQPNVTQAMVDQRDTGDMAASFRQAFANFQAAEGDGSSPAGLDSWLSSSGGDAQAKAYLDGMKSAFKDLAQSGLNSAEVSHSRLFVARHILGGGADIGLTPAGLAAAMGPGN